jgi:hypothetical protein
MKYMDKLRETLQGQYGVVTRGQAHAAGWGDRRIKGMIRSGAWRQIHRGIYGSLDVPGSHEQDISAACLALGTRVVASHRSAAWVWDLVKEPPTEVDLTAPRSIRADLVGVQLHRPRHVEGLHVVTHRRLPVTNPLWTLVDLGSVLDADEFDSAVDLGVASGRITVEGIVAELSRRSCRGRDGLGLVRDRLEARGFVNEPQPSVLESMTHRFLHRIRVGWLTLEVAFFGGRYRVDVQLARKVFLEVDGFAYHSNPEA